MSCFRKLSHTIWHCHYHIVWTPKYRYRVLTGEVKQEVEQCIRFFTDYLKCGLVELNVQADPVHVLVMIPPKISVSTYVGTVRGRTAIRVLNRFRQLRRKPCWGNHFRTQGYCVDMADPDTEKIRAYVKYQERQERKMEQKQLF